MEDRIKLVVNFTLATTETAIRNRYENVVVPEMKSKLPAQLIGNVGSLVSSHALRVIDFGGNNWQVYPKIIFSGTYSNIHNFADKINALIAEFKVVLQAELDRVSATNVVWHEGTL